MRISLGQSDLRIGNRPWASGLPHRVPQQDKGKTLGFSAVCRMRAWKRSMAQRSLLGSPHFYSALTNQTRSRLPLPSGPPGIQEDGAQPKLPNSLAADLDALPGIEHFASAQELERLQANQDRP